MSEAFSIVCRKCEASIELRLTKGQTLKPFTCPGCGHVLVVDAKMASTPIPQHDQRRSPASGATVTHLFGDGSRVPDVGTCPVCGLPELVVHEACEDAQQVEPYDPTAP